MTAAAALRPRRALPTILAIAALSPTLAIGFGCSDGSTPATDPDVASIRLFADRTDVTDHIALNAGFTQRLAVNLHAADGRQITGLDDRYTITFEFTPASLATAAAVNGRPLQKDVTPIAAPDEAGSLRVTLSRPERGSPQSFGPFDVLIH